MLWDKVVFLYAKLNSKELKEFGWKGNKRRLTVKDMSYLKEVLNALRLSK